MWSCESISIIFETKWGFDLIFCRAIKKVKIFDRDTKYWGAVSISGVLCLTSIWVCYLRSRWGFWRSSSPFEIKVLLKIKVLFVIEQTFSMVNVFFKINIFRAHFFIFSIDRPPTSKSSRSDNHSPSTLPLFIKLCKYITT